MTCYKRGMRKTKHKGTPAAALLAGGLNRAMFETVAERRARCSHLNTIELADGTRVCIACEAVIAPVAP